MTTLVDSGRIGTARYFIDQWGGNPSVVTYGQGIISHQVAGQWWQYAAWYGPDKYVRVARKDPSGGWETIVLPDVLLNYDDSHNAICLGISQSDGRLHLVAGQHNDPVQYTVSEVNVLNEVPAWSASLFSTMSSTLNGTVIGDGSTLPTFTSKPNGGLLFWYREGRSGNGRLRLAEYDEGQWTLVGQITSSTGNWQAPNNAVSPTRNLYWAAPLYGHGKLHLIGTWREWNNATMCVPTAPWTNHHIVYCYSEDDGRTWKNNAGTVIATTGSDPIGVSDNGIHVPYSTYDSRNAIQCYDMAVGPNGLIGYLPDYVSPELLGPANCVQNMDERFAKANHHPRWRVAETGEWPAATVKINGVEQKCGWPAGRRACTRGKMTFTPTGDMVVIFSGIRIYSARASTGYADWRLDVDGTKYFNAFGEFHIDRSREADGIVSLLYIEQAPTGASSSAVCVRDFML